MSWIKAFVGIWMESRNGVEGATIATRETRCGDVPHPRAVGVRLGAARHLGGETRSAATVD
jgi:hypothetical protein